MESVKQSECCPFAIHLVFLTKVTTAAINSASTAVSETFGENTAAAKKEGDKVRYLFAGVCLRLVLIDVLSLL